jgi:hypothetical protein
MTATTETEAPGLLRTAELAARAGLTLRQANYWYQCGYLVPAAVPLNKYGTGIGFALEWTAAELEIARLMGRLVAGGLTPAAAVRIARSGEARYEVSPGIWLEIGPALSDECGEDDHGACFPDEPSACGCDCHEEPQP